jgi:hypothetical protein
MTYLLCVCDSEQYPLLILQYQSHYMNQPDPEAHIRKLVEVQLERPRRPTNRSEDVEGRNGQRSLLCGKHRGKGDE